MSPQRGDRLPQVRGSLWDVIRCQHCSTPRHLGLTWHFNHMYRDNQSQHQSKPGVSSGDVTPRRGPHANSPRQPGEVLDHDQALAMQGRRVRHIPGAGSPGTAAILLWRYFKHPVGVRHPPSRSRAPGARARQGASRARDVSRMGACIHFYSCKALAMQGRKRHQNVQKTVDNPRKTQFLSVPHENPHVAGGQEGGSSIKARESIELPSAAQGEAVARQK